MQLTTAPALHALIREPVIDLLVAMSALAKRNSMEATVRHVSLNNTHGSTKSLSVNLKKKLYGHSEIVKKKQNVLELHATQTDT